MAHMRVELSKNKAMAKRGHDSSLKSHVQQISTAGLVSAFSGSDSTCARADARHARSLRIRNIREYISR